MLRISEAEDRQIPLRTRIPIEIPELLQLVANSPAEFLDEIGPKFFLIGVGVRPSAATPVRVNLLAVDETGNAVIVTIRRQNYQDVQCGRFVRPVNKGQVATR